jgi:hypothetical protein
MKTPTTVAIDLIRFHVSKGLSLDDSARRFASVHPELALCVMENIGSYPSSERELGALQRVWK